MEGIIDQFFPEAVSTQDKWQSIRKQDVLNKIFIEELKGEPKLITRSAAFISEIIIFMVIIYML